MTCPGTPLPFSVTITEIFFRLCDLSWNPSLLIMTVPDNVTCSGTLLPLIMTIPDDVTCPGTLLPLIMTVPDEVTWPRTFYPLL
jgi:hypothetical protein